MGLRSKFLLILIIFSVVPLLGFFLINQKLFDKLGDEFRQGAAELSDDEIESLVDEAVDAVRKAS